jgi:hypothetical protein
LLTTTSEDWIVPDFSTTTDADIAIVSKAMVATMKSYFDYPCASGCGFPSVTLLGDKEDWVNMRGRIDLLASGKYGDGLVARSGPLISIFNRFVATSNTLTTRAVHVFHAGIV